MTADTGITYTPTTPNDGPERLIADRTLYCDADRSTLIEDGEPGAAWIVAGVAGQEIREDFVRDLGLIAKDGKVTQSKDGSSASDAADADGGLVTHEIARELTDARIAAENTAAREDGVVDPKVFADELADTAPDPITSDDVKERKGDKNKERKSGSNK